MTTEQCCRCGHFCKPYDASTSYGSYYDPLPEEDVWCEACAKEMEEKAVADERIPDGFYLSPQWRLNAARRLQAKLAKQLNGTIT